MSELWNTFDMLMVLGFYVGYTPRNPKPENLNRKP
jgi:hypothetical protein